MPAEVVRERERQPEQAGDLGAVAAGAEQPHRRPVPDGRYREHRAVAVEVGHQLGELLREVVGAQRVGAAAQRGGGARVGARGAPDAQVDPARVQRLQGAELLGHDQRLVVGQHHAAGADPDPGAGAARCAISTAGDELPMPGMPWCSATQYRWKPSSSARRTSVVLCRRAAVAVDPEPMGTRSSTERGTTAGATRFPPGFFPAALSSRSDRQARSDHVRVGRAAVRRVREAL